MSKIRSKLARLKSISNNVNRMCNDSPDMIMDRRDVVGERKEGETHSNYFLQRKQNVEKANPFYELTNKDVEDLSLIFKIFTTKALGKLCFSELQNALSFLNLGMEEDILVKILKAKGLYNNNFENYDLDNFLTIVIECQNVSRNIKEEILSGFHAFDLDKKERLTLPNLKYLNKKYNVGLSLEELNEMLVEADTKGNQSISYTDFFSVMMKTHLFQ